MILDLYAGAGGWDEAARQLGLTTVGLEIWHDACVTAVRAGHPRIRCDIATYPTAPFAGRVTGLIASPPCQAWSMAGKRTGEQDKARVHDLVNAYAAGANEPGDGWADPRSHHAAQPVRWIRDLRPEWVCLEQVPPVIDLWRHIGDVLRGWGYSVWVGVLNAADYGVPQTRQRAILIASRVRTVTRPPATHEQNPPEHALFGALRPWVSMAQALGWEGIDRPARTVCGDRSPRWAYGQGNSYATGWTLVNGPQGNATAREVDEPAGTIYCSRPGNLRWALRNGTQDNACVRTMEEPAGTLFFGRRLNNVSWVRERPATTVQGDPRIGRPGHKDREGGESQFEQDALRVTVAEAAILQSFPAEYPWHGTKTSQFLQVGNAVPPGLAAAVIAQAAGISTAHLTLAA